MIPQVQKRPVYSEAVENELMKMFGIGRYGAGNIDLFNRPMYMNPDGSVSTVYSMGTNIDGQEVLLPRVAYNPANGKPYIMSEQEAFDRYRRTGEHLGMFNNVNDANAYAEKLHKQQEYLYSK